MFIELNLILNIFAVVTAYFAMFLSFRDACTGIVMNVLKRITSEENLNRRVLKYGISVFCVLLCWGIILVNAPILKFTPILGRLIGIIACFLPACLVWKLDYLKKYKDWKLIPVIFMGLILLISPIISLW